MILSKYFQSLDAELITMPEFHSDQYLMYNTGGIEAEVGSFLYGLIRLMKPKSIFETGTGQGISAMYMAQALKDNGCGALITIERQGSCVENSKSVFRRLGLVDFVDVILVDSKDYNLECGIDFLWLDSEPMYRYGEMVKFYPNLRHNGLVGIHDLAFDMEHHHTEFAPLPEEIKNKIVSRKLSYFNFLSPRGMTLFQKHENFDI